MWWNLPSWWLRPGWARRGDKRRRIPRLLWRLFWRRRTRLPKLLLWSPAWVYHKKNILKTLSKKCSTYSILWDIQILKKLNTKWGSFLKHYNQYLSYQKHIKSMRIYIFYFIMLRSQIYQGRLCIYIQKLINKVSDFRESKVSRDQH